MHHIRVSIWLHCSRLGKGVSPVVPKIESLKRADEVDVASEATDPVVTKP